MGCINRDRHGWDVQERGFLQRRFEQLDPVQCDPHEPDVLCKSFHRGHQQLGYRFPSKHDRYVRRGHPVQWRSGQLGREQRNPYEAGFLQCPVVQGTGLEFWDVSSVTTFYEAFQSATSFDANLSAWTPTAATTMYSMFYNAQSFQGGDLTGWDVSNVTNMSRAFYNCDSFTGDVST